MAQLKTAVYLGTRNLYPDMVTAVKSLLKNSPVEQVWFLIEDDKFPYPLPPEVRVKNVAKQKYFPPGGPNYDSHWTWMVLMKAALPKLFPKLDRILCLDCDTIVEDDISALWELPLEEEYFAAVAEIPQSREHGYTYYNMGVAMFNLKKLRDGKCDEVIAALNERAFDYPEQDALNELCKGRILRLPGDWNITDCTGGFMERKIRHYAGETEAWRTWALASYYRRMPWERVRAAYAEEKSLR